jgi:hypothetical protein
MRKTPVLLLSLLAMGCVTRPPETSAFKYFEVSFSDYSCGPDQCFREYMALSNGLVFEKIGSGLSGKPAIRIGNASTEQVARVASLVENFSSTKGYCRDCPHYTIFYYDGTARHFEASSGAEFKEAGKLEQESRALLDSSSPAEKFLAHTVKVKNGGETENHHVFSDGTVVFELFSSQGELSSASVYSITPQKTSEIKGIVSKVFSYPQGKCPANGLDYAYVEAVEGSNYAFTFTCGGDEAWNALAQVEKLAANYPSG